jgi:hypothetical protein
MHFRLVRTVQGTSGPLATTADFDLVRRGATTLVIERPQPGGTPNVSVLSINRDGSIAVPDPARAAAADADLADLLGGLNLGIAAIRGAEGTPRAWAASVPVLPAATGASALVSIVPGATTANGFDFAGDGQVSVAAAAPERRARGGGFPGGGGFPRGGRSRGGGGEGGPDGGGSQTVAVHVEGRVNAGQLERITVSQTRSVVIGEMPYVNVSSWMLSSLP